MHKLKIKKGKSSPISNLKEFYKNKEKKKTQVNEIKNFHYYRQTLYFQIQSVNLLEKNPRAKLGNIFQFSNTKEVQFSREENVTV